MKIYIQKIVYLVGIKICYIQGRSQLFMGGGASHGVRSRKMFVGAHFEVTYKI